MAAKKKATPVYEPDLTYDVILLKPVKMGAMKFRPIDAHEMTGAFLTALIDEHGGDIVDTATERK